MKNLKNHGLTLDNMINITEKEIKKLISTTNFKNSKAKYIKAAARKIKDDYNEKVPNTKEDVLSIKGVGHKIANLLLFYGFGKQ